jgi:nitroreductase
MELYDTVRARRSVRDFEDRAVPREVLGRLLEAARQAPSANNLMPWRFVVVTDPSIRSAIAASGTYGRFLSKAPVAIAALGDETVSPKWFAVDTAIALEHIVLAAVAEGLGSCWIGSFDEAKVLSLLGAPEGQRIVALLALGYPKDRIDPKKLVNIFIHPTKKIDGIAADRAFTTPWKIETRD